MRFLLLFFLALLIPSDLAAQKIAKIKKDDSKEIERYLNSDTRSEKTTPVNIPKLDEENIITIDGNLDENLWQRAALFKDFIQTSPGDNIAPSKPTEVFMFSDKSNLYIAFKCFDEKDKIRATVVDRDNVFTEDNVHIWLDTYNDRRRAYLLAWNPLGIQADAIFTDGQGSDFSVDIVMESKGAIHEWGWAVEVKIPFKSLRYKAGEGKFWGFNAARTIHRLNNEVDTWMPNDRNIQGTLIQHGKIVGLTDISSERTLELIPSITVSETGTRVSDSQIPEGRFVNQPVKQDLSLNLKYTITPNIILDAAINPDFAEIEADAPVVTANQRFPIFFAEKRPFFLEGADTFQSPLFLFNSRTIVDPDAAVKVTGKVGKNSFGVLVASDNAPGNFSEGERSDPNRRPFIDEFIDKNAAFAVVRLKRDFGKENNVGFFGTARTFPKDKNFTGGFDGQIKVNTQSVFTFQAVGTNSKKCFFDPKFDPNENPFQSSRNEAICGGNSFSRYRTGNGFGYFANYAFESDQFAYSFQAGARSSFFRADVGFTRRTDNYWSQGILRLSTKSKPKNKIVRIDYFNFVGSSYTPEKSRLQGFEWNTNVNFTLQKNTNFSVWTGVAPLRVYEDEFGLARNENRNGAFFGDPKREVAVRWFGGSFYTNPIKQVAFTFNINHAWDVFDFDFGAGPKFPRVSPAALDGESRLDPGSGRRITLTATVDYTPIDPLKISFTYDKARLLRYDTNRVAFDSNIFSTKATYNFTRFIFARARIDYDTLQSNVLGQYLFGWTPSPGKAFYIGYNDDSNYNGFNPYTGQLENGFSRNSRTFFIRLSYLFRKSF